jgi:hypothetical protein
MKVLGGSSMLAITYLLLVFVRPSPLDPDCCHAHLGAAEMSKRWDE